MRIEFQIQMPNGDLLSPRQAVDVGDLILERCQDFEAARVKIETAIFDLIGDQLQFEICWNEAEARVDLENRIRLRKAADAEIRLRWESERNAALAEAGKRNRIPRLPKERMGLSPIEQGET